MASVPLYCCNSVSHREGAATKKPATNSRWLLPSWFCIPHSGEEGHRNKTTRLLAYQAFYEGALLGENTHRVHASWQMREVELLPDRAGPRLYRTLEHHLPEGIE